MGITYVVIVITFFIVIYNFLNPIYKFIKTEKEIFRIYEIFINDKKNIIENNLYKKEKMYCYEFGEWEKRVKEVFNNKERIKEKDLTINPEILITLEKYERWRNSQNRGR